MGEEDSECSKKSFNDSVSSCSSNVSFEAIDTQLTNSLSEITTLHRRESKKRRITWVEDGFKSKRLNSYYNDEYREILNCEIQQIACKANQNDLYVYPESQIGSSIWTTEEKAFFFTALDTLGKGNIRGISQRIGSKSVLEVQEYLLTLQCNRNARRYSPDNCTALDIPIAREISGKCCSLLERAGDAIAAQQECFEVNIEQEKWGDIWLITNDICEELIKDQNHSTKIKSMEKFKPIETLFKLENWLELSKRLFMNNAACEEENWETLVEPGEMPAIRATALEDFYSLTISITKRIVSATLFCAMSRLRAKSLSRSNDPQINSDDVKAAIRTLELKCNSDEFWIGCARRCRLDVVKATETKETRTKSDVSKEEKLSELTTKMSYDEVEKTMKFYCQLNSKKTGVKFGINYSNPVIIEDDGPEILINERDLNESYSGSETRASVSDEYRDDISEVSSSSQSRSELRQLARLESFQESQELYVDEIDMQVSQEEEMVFWKILKQKPSFEVNITKISTQQTPNFIPDANEDEDWRSYLEYHSEWESFVRQTSSQKISFSRETSLNEDEQRKELDLVEEQDKKIDGAKTESDDICDNQKSTNYDRCSSSSDHTDHTMMNLRLLAANSQP